MNEINVDCQNVVKNFSSLLTIEDLYNNANYSIPNDQVITSLSIDEEVNNPGESFAFLKSKIANFQHVSFNTQSKNCFYIEPGATGFTTFIELAKLNEFGRIIEPFNAFFGNENKKIIGNGHGTF